MREVSGRCDDDDDDASAHALFSCPLFEGEKFKRDDGEHVDATKTTTHLRGDGRKVPGIRGVLRQNGLGAIIARRGDERVYERHDTLRRAQKKNEDQEKGTPLPLFPKQRPKEELYTNRENNTRWESETNLKSTRVKQKEKERRRRRKKEDMRMDRHKKRKHNSWSSRYYCLLTLLLAFQ